MSMPGRNVACGNSTLRTTMPMPRMKSASRSVSGLVNMSRRLGERRFHLGECPVDPLRQQLDVAGLDSGAAPDPQPRRGVAIVREIIARAFLLHQRDQFLGEVRLRIGGQ